MDKPKIINCIVFEGCTYIPDQVVEVYDDTGFGQYRIGRIITITDKELVLDASEQYKRCVVTINIDRITQIRPY